MFGKLKQLSFISALFLSLIHLPTHAETVNGQSTTQNANVSGENNQVYQTIYQTIINHPARRQNDHDKKKVKQNNRVMSSQDDLERREQGRRFDRDSDDD